MSRRTAAALLLLATAACAADEAFVRPQPRPLPRASIAVARAAGPGARVLVEGVVSVAPGPFEDGFAVQDRSGGVWVLSPTWTVRLAPGDRVRLQGTLDVRNGQLALRPEAIEPLGTRGAAEPRAVATGAVAGAEGWLVRVRGRVVAAPQDDAGWGWRVRVDDGSGAALLFVDADTGVDAALFRPGAMVEVVGFASRYGERLEILPRGAADVRAVP